jgi:1-acyl-sn-glycerol-3-phosphate acyltransferase
MKVKAAMIPRLVVAALGATIITLIWCPIMLVCGLISKSGRANYHISKAWCVIVAKLLGISYSLHNRHKVQEGQSYIICPNHQGNADILALIITLPIPYKWVIKKELLNVPFFGQGLGATGAISIDRSNPEEAIRKIRDGADKIGGGWSILIYPEGTRTVDGTVRAFKKGAFMIACESGLPILPVTVNGAHKILPKSSIVFHPGHITVTLHDPIPTAGLTSHDIPELMDKTRTAILSALDYEYDPFDPANRTLSEAPQN